jgi:hypothetical protein
MVDGDVKSFIHRGIEYIEIQSGSSYCDGCAFQHFKDCTKQIEKAVQLFGYDCDQRDVIYIKKSASAKIKNSSFTSPAEELYRAEIAAKQAIIDQLTAKLDAVQNALEN